MTYQKNEKYVLAIDAGGTYFKSGIVSSDGKVLSESMHSVKANSDKDAESVKNAYFDTIRLAYSFAEKACVALSGIAVDTPGPFDFENGISLMQHKFQAIYGIPLKDWFYKAAGKEMPVRFIHDSAAFILGELWGDRFSGVKNAAGVMLGTGLGFALVKDGVLQLRDNGTPKVSIYASPLYDGIAEDYISRRGVIGNYRRLMTEAGLEYDAFADAREIGDMADSGNKIASRAYAYTGECLAKVLKPILKEYGSELLVLGGQISRSFAHMEGALREGLCECATLRTVTLSERIETGHMVGAAYGFFLREGGLESKCSVSF